MLASAQLVGLEVHTGAIVPTAVKSPVHDLIYILRLGIPDIEDPIHRLIAARHNRKHLLDGKLTAQLFLPFFRAHALRLHHIR